VAGRFSLGGDEPRKPKKRFSLEDKTPTKRQKSMAQEDRLADRARKAHGRRVPASGALPGMPGDVEVFRFLLEAKRTDGAGLYLSDKKIEKAEEEAAGRAMVPGLAHELEGKKRGRQRWVTIPEDVFYALLDAVGGEAEKWA